MWTMIESIFERNKGAEIAVMGSSLGGFLATKVAEKFSVKVLLINPAVTADLLFTEYQGRQTHPYLQQQYDIDENYIKQIKTLITDNIDSPENIWVLLQQQDEVLDYRDAMKKYKSCKITCESGGDHSFIGFDRYLADIINFLY